MDAGSCLPWRGIRWHTGRTSANAATRQTRAGAIGVPPNYRVATLILSERRRERRLEVAVCEAVAELERPLGHRALTLDDDLGHLPVEQLDRQRRHGRE